MVDIVLSAAIAMAALADADALRLTARQLEDASRDKIIVEDDVSRLQRAYGLEREVLGIAGAGANKDHASRLTRHTTFDLVHQPINGCDLAHAGRSLERPLGKPLPEGAPLRADGELPPNLGAY
jgi:hypothetical protein